MPITGYLAMTAAEIAVADSLPAGVAWMACHFSCYGTGLSNLPRSLPKGSMIIVNDRTPVHGHDPTVIAGQLEQLAKELSPSCFLLDLQRPGIKETAQIVTCLVQKLSCPVGVSQHYAEGLDCPVFVSMPPPDTDVGQYLSQWKDRQVWLELATDSREACITEQGCCFTVCPVDRDNGPIFFDDTALCSYRIRTDKDAVTFHLWRDKDALHKLLRTAPNITTAVGLYQQLGADFFP